MRARSLEGIDAELTDRGGRFEIARKRGDRVAILGAKGPEWITSAWASVSLGDQNRFVEE